MNFLFQTKISKPKKERYVAARLAGGFFTKLSCHSILLKHRSVMHHTVCSSAEAMLQLKLHTV